MKRATSTVNLEPINDLAVSTMHASGKVSPAIFDLLHCIAEVMDLAAKGEDIYMTIGKNRDKTALLITVTWDKHPERLSGCTLEDLAAQAHTLL